MTVRFGMAQWQHTAWVDWLYPRSEAASLRLGSYAHWFDAVELGSSFYTDLSPEQVGRWVAQVPDTFRFSFKVPSKISHHLDERLLDDVLLDWQAFQTLLQPFSMYLGPTMLQFPAALGPDKSELIKGLIETWMFTTPLSVEVRHLAFFDKADSEKKLLRLLSDWHCDKVVMDSRPVFSTSAYCESLKDAQQKKPRVPCHAVATNMHPIVRYIGHPDLERNHVWLEQWADKLIVWMEEGRQPTVFVHSSDNNMAPVLASWLDEKLASRMNSYQRKVHLPAQHEQMGLL